MAEILGRITSMLPEENVNALMTGVRGHSAIANLANSTPIAFNGQREFIFTMDKEIDIVAEGGKKSNGGATVTPVTVIPIKFEYGTRCNQEVYLAQDGRWEQFLAAFADGFAKKVARGLDIAAFHGLNPRTGAASAVVGDNHFDAVSGSEPVITTLNYTKGADSPDDVLDAAITAIRANDGDVTGIAMAPAYASDLATVKVNGVVQYPEFRFGGRPAAFAGMGLDINTTVPIAASGAKSDLVIAGNFRDALRWGYAREIPLTVIPYGNPDNDEALGDLAGHNQVYVRSEVFLGWGILNPAEFVIVREA